MPPKRHFETAPFYESIEVGMEEWAMGTAGQIVETAGLGPCIGIAIHDEDSKIGHILHITVPEDDEHILNDFLQSVANHTTDISKLCAWIRGGSLSGGKYDHLNISGIDTKDYEKQNRKYAKQALMEFGIPEGRIKEELSDIEEDTVHMALNCSTGKCEIIREPFEPDWADISPDELRYE